MGRVTRAHGIRGEVVVKLTTDRLERVAPGSVLTYDRGQLEVVASRPHQGAHLVAFAGVADRSAAEALRGAVLHAPPIDDPDVLWVHELVGSEVVDTAGMPLGVVEAVEANPASDLLVLDGGGLIPLTFVTDRLPGRVTVELPPGLLDEAR